MIRLKLDELKSFREKYASVRRMAQLTDFAPNTILNIEKGITNNFRFYLKYAQVLTQLSKKNIDIDFTE